MVTWGLVLTFFVIGFLEMFCWALQTKTLIKDRVIGAFFATYVAVLIWYYVVQSVAKNLDDPVIMHVYCLGCALGVALTIKFDKWLSKLAESQVVYRAQQKKLKLASSKAIVKRIKKTQSKIKRVKKNGKRKSKNGTSKH